MSEDATRALVGRSCLGTRQRTAAAAPADASCLFRWSAARLARLGWERAAPSRAQALADPARRGPGQWPLLHARLLL
ncbi:hypothetical protein NDU88_007485 [Pleurodeles waltl]|uniref:Uncharacterized protein n=1 Tax=Pleurodeles waltl TaxID=8319 RepID=A0AAV7MFB8_PLEWA|nr:hypothetical protein NDU88_007485 [Pleurodeles waltl]